MTILVGANGLQASSCSQVLLCIFMLESSPDILPWTPPHPNQSSNPLQESCILRKSIPDTPPIARKRKCAQPPKVIPAKKKKVSYTYEQRNGWIHCRYIVSYIDQNS